MKTLALVLSLLPFAAIAFDPDIIIDANDANNPGAPATVTFTGAWSNEVAPNLANAFRGDSKVVGNSSSSTHAVFKTRLPKTGPYSVFVWHNGGTSYFGYTHTAQVTHADTAPSTATLNQYMYPGQWLLLGTFWFEGNDNGLNTCKEAEVKIIGSGNTKLSADAVRFMPATADITLDSDSGGSAVAFYPTTGAGTWSSVAEKAGTAGNVRRSNGTASTVTYTFTVPVSGDYDVSLWLPGNAFSGTNTWLASNLTGAASFQVEVQHPTVASQNPPASTTVTVNLPTVSQNEGQWVRLINPATATADAPRTGTFRFKPTGTNLVNKVTIKTAGVSPSNAYVPADAVRLSKVGTWATFQDEDDPAPVAPNPPTYPFGQPGVTSSGSWTNNTAVSARVWSDWSKAQSGPAWKSFNFTQTTQGPASLTFTPLIDQLGLYDIYLWYPIHYYASYYNSLGTQVSVQHASGTLTGTVSQQSGTGMWRHAGRFTLRASDHATYPPKVTISTPAVPPIPPYNWWYTNQGYVLADGIMILRDDEGVDSDSDGVMDWLETLSGTNPNGGTTDYNYIAGTLGYYPEHATLSVTVTAPSGATVND